MEVIVRDVVCIDCRATVDRCWWWCPECGNLILVDPSGADGSRPDELVWEWEIGSGGRFDDRPPVRSSA
jgi:hypothetical protein